MVPSMTDLPLLDFNPAAHARRGDPDTSHEAARSHEGQHARHCTAILRVLRAHGALAAEEIARIGAMSSLCPDWPFELDKVAICKRFRDLESAGLIVRTTERYRNASGRWAFKVRAT